jgi:hypothetical protein
MRCWRVGESIKRVRELERREEWRKERGWESVKISKSLTIFLVDSKKSGKGFVKSF